MVYIKGYGVYKKLWVTTCIQKVMVYIKSYGVYNFSWLSNLYIIFLGYQICIYKTFYI